MLHGRMRLGCLLLPVGLMLAAPAAMADVSDTIFRIEATSTLGNAVLEVGSDQLVPDPATGGQRWELPAAYDLWGTTELIARLEQATVRIVDDPTNVPRILVNFTIIAGAADAEFLVNSPVVSFAPLPAALSAGNATAGFTLTDYNDGVLAELSGMDPDNALGIFTAQYNGYPAGTVFANLVPYLSVGDGGTDSASDAVPPVGTWQPIGVDVTDIAFDNAFTLTALDSMSGQTSFLVIPEPVGSLALLAAGGIAMLRRRR
jgi:hypothetical protein